jgi:ferredoxin-NADP reductase
MRVKIKNKKEVAAGTLRVEFDTGENKVDFKPGQHMVVTLINPSETDAEGNSRYFSIVNSPFLKSNVLAITTRLRNTAFKRALKNLPIGAEVEIDQIGGNFVLPGETTVPLGFITGGIGITPFMSMLSYITEVSLAYNITLLYSNRDKASTAYFDYLTDLAQKNKNIKVVFVMTQDPSWDGETKHIDSSVIKKYFSNPNDFIYYIAGPPKMVRAAYQAVVDSGVNPSHIKTENFDGYETQVSRLT